MRGIDDIVLQLRVSILHPLLHADKFAALGIAPPRGVLLHGPAGVGKTSIAQAIANEAKANFVSVQCPDIVSKIVGQSSRAISDLFKRARSSSPCVLFFD
jgi:ATP-dependent 26S proteasome regulatory subunit